MISTPAAALHLRDLARLRRVRDRIDREYAQPLNVEALARDIGMSAGHLSRQPGMSIVLYPPAASPSGAEIVEEPTEQPYGVRDCAVRDPAGNLLRIQERP